jgi:branched-chain amino acid transport system ATP-binding protein
MTLELRGVTAGYGTSTVLRDIDLVVPSGSVVALIGPNGAGKTTLLRVASGLLSPSRGRVFIDGQDVTREAPHRRMARGMCHVPEGRGLFASLSVADNLRLAGPTGRDQTSAAVAAFPRLGERFRQRAGTLSGGEQQMLALAPAYLTDPNLMLVDEVSLGLAPRLVDDLYVHLRALAERGAAMLLVEQYIARALELADYVYLLRRGRVAFVGEPGELGESHVLEAYLGGAT